MSSMGQQPSVNMQAEAASALHGAPPGANGAQPPQVGGQGGSLAEFAQAFARCEQTKQCTPQDRAILEAGLPKLIQMVSIVQQLLKVAQPGQQQPAPQPGPAQ